MDTTKWTACRYCQKDSDHSEKYFLNETNAQNNETNLHFQ